MRFAEEATAWGGVLKGIAAFFAIVLYSGHLDTVPSNRLDISLNHVFNHL